MSLEEVIKGIERDNFLTLETIINNGIDKFKKTITEFEYEFQIIKPECELNIIIPIRGRETFIDFILERLVNEGLENFDAVITVVEHSKDIKIKNICGNYNLNYIRINDDGNFNKSLCMNLGVESVKSNHILFYDIDIFLKNEFLKKIYENISYSQCDFLQCYSNRKVFSLNDTQTLEILNKSTKVEDLTDNFEDYDDIHIEPDGGLIWVTNDLFNKIGGYEDFLLDGWGCEDSLFINKSKLYGKVSTAEFSKIFAYHLNHERAEKNLNNKTICERFYHLTDFYKLKIVEKLKNEFELRKKYYNLNE